MAQVEVVGDRLVIQLDRADWLWSFRSELQVPWLTCAESKSTRSGPGSPGADCRSGARTGGCQPWASAASINQALAVGPGRTTEAPAEPAPNVARAPGSRPPL
jgi:hypothetical protein